MGTRCDRSSVARLLAAELHDSGVVLGPSALQFQLLIPPSWLFSHLSQAPLGRRRIWRWR
jgi:hypothetical protein